MGAAAPRIARPHERGSAFVEAMIAAAIVAMSLSAALHVIADGAARARAVESRSAALLVAQSEMDAAGAEIPLASGTTDGVAGDMIWRVDISPYPEGGEANASGVLWRVVVGVRSRAGGPDLVTLDSLRLGRKA